MEVDQRKRIEQIKADMKCPNDFACCNGGADRVCKVRDRGLEGYVECLEEHPGACEFRVPFGNSAYCRCPLRVYMIKESLQG